MAELNNDSIDRESRIMERTKYYKHKVKRQHQIIEGILPILEDIGKIDGVKKVTPAAISYNPKRKISMPEVKIQRETISGLKLIARSKGVLQEVFITIEQDKRQGVITYLKSMKNCEGIMILGNCREKIL